MPMCLTDIPSDIVNCVAEYLGVSDYVSLSSTSRKCLTDLQAEDTARRCIEHYLGFSQDGKERFPKARSHGFRKRLSEVSDSKEALQTARPYSASIIGHATSFVYEQGVLCYCDSSGLRILNLRAEGTTEKVISFKFFMHKVALPGDMASSPALQPSMLELLGYCDDVLTVKCDFGQTKGCYFLAVNLADSNVRTRCLLKHRLRRTDHLFACHNEHYLYYGTLSARGSHGHQEWLIQGFNLSTGYKVTDEPIQLHDFAGSDLGTSVAFTIYEGHFYALSNQTSYESEEVNWTSYYHYIKFAVNEKDPKIEIKTIFRRQDDEGPINDAWTTLAFQIDHETGELLIVECRKEWIGGGSSAVRTYYVQSWDRAYHDEWDRANTVNPNDHLRLTVTEKDNARFEMAPHPRVPKYTHTEFQEGRAVHRQEYLRAKTKHHCYDFNTQCYIDLVMDEVADEGSWRKKERVRLRVASRLLKSPLDCGVEPRDIVEEPQPRLRPRFTDREEVSMRDSEDAYTDSKVYLWPPDGMDVPKELGEMLCPGGKVGEIKSRVGEEGIVYMVGLTGQCSDGEQGSERALVFLSFDPTWGFEGMKRIDGQLARPRSRSGTDMAMSGTEAAQKRRADSPDVRTGVKRRRTENVTRASTAASIASATSSTVPRERLLWKEKAKYLSISRGYWLR